MKSSDSVERSTIKLLKSEFSTDPDRGGASIDRGDVTHSNSIIGTKHSDPISSQYRQLVVRITKPHTAHAVGEFTDDTRTWKIFAATKRCPNAIRQPVQAMTPERDPETTIAIL